jgi:hypothetical protein
LRKEEECFEHSRSDPILHSDIPLAAYANDDDHGNFYSTSTLVLVMTTMATDNDRIG